jgi:hypothetical protein
MLVVVAVLVATQEMVALALIEMFQVLLAQVALQAVVQPAVQQTLQEQAEE